MGSFNFKSINWKKQLDKKTSRTENGFIQIMKRLAIPMWLTQCMQYKYLLIAKGREYEDQHEKKKTTFVKDEFL